MTVNLKRLIIRVIAGLVIILFLAALIGAVYQEIGLRSDKRNFPPPGRMVAVDNTRLHINCSGEGSPTVVLESGATGFSGTWAWVQSEVSKVTRVCSYDRAGMGWSEQSPNPRDGVTIARELRNLLKNAGENAPFVVVGHSLGGTFVRIFAQQYKQDVAGIVLLDSSHPNQLERFPPDFVEDFHSFVNRIGYSPILARLGVIRAINPFAESVAGLPEREYKSAIAISSTPKHLSTSYEELALWDKTMAQARENRSLGNLPLSVISASIMPDASPGIISINHVMHRELAGLSSRGTYKIIEGSDHFTVLMRQEYAQKVAEEIIKIVEDVRVKTAAQ